MVPSALSPRADIAESSPMAGIWMRVPDADVVAFFVGDGLGLAGVLDAVGVGDDVGDSVAVVDDGVGATADA